MQDLRIEESFRIRFHIADKFLNEMLWFGTGRTDKYRITAVDMVVYDL